MQWIKITPTSSIPLREGRPITVAGRDIAIFHLPTGFMAVDNRCPHGAGPLCDGITSGTKVACPLHGWKICLESGKVERPNVDASVRTYPVRVNDGIIEMNIAPALAAVEPKECAA